MDVGQEKMAAMSEKRIKAVEAGALKGWPLRAFDFVMAAFVTILLLSNVLGAGKVATIDLPGIGAWPFGAGILFFPIAYVLGDVLTEVYGYARARRCIWAGFGAVVHGVHGLGRRRPAARGELDRPGRL